MDTVARLKEIGFLFLLLLAWFLIHEIAHFILAPWPFVKSYNFSMNPPGWEWFFNQPVSFWIILPSQLAGGNREFQESLKKYLPEDQARTYNFKEWRPEGLQIEP